MDLRSLIVFMAIMAPVMIKAQSTSSPEDLMPEGEWVSGVEQDESFPQYTSKSPYNWTNASVSWQRTAYHFQPRKNWMNDPCGPLFHMGWYHLFYQYNPNSAVWGDIAWGHAISTDLIHWYHLPLAMACGNSSDTDGVYTGSATHLPDGRIVMLYTGKIGKPGKSKDQKQLQNLAYPANLSDPALRDWVKYEGNPVLKPPPEIDQDDFRDPTTAWLGPDGTWRVAIGAKYHNDNDTCVFLVYQTSDFISYLSKGVLHKVRGMGMWECLDIYPISMIESGGLDNSATGPGIKHVLKAGAGDKNDATHAYDYYALGTYDRENDEWVPDYPEELLGFGLKVDYGRYYASKTFYDPNKMRRINWGYIVEADDKKKDHVNKGWAGIQSIPRVVEFDQKTRNNILQWPVEELESLRLSSIEFDRVEVGPGSRVPLDIGTATDQLDISADFEIDKEALEENVDEHVNYDCGGGAAVRGSFGPFGLLVNAHTSLSELTPIYFHIAKTPGGTLKTFFCADKSRSSKASSVDKQIYGAEVPVLYHENFSMRLLVDHSVVESFAQGGRTVITVRIYPTEAIYEAARLFLFNNATKVSVVASLKIWKMKSLSFEDYKD